MDMLKITANQGDESAARMLADQIKSYVEANSCNWQKGLVASALIMTGRKGEAKLNYERTMAEYSSAAKPFEQTSETIPPDLVMAAAQLDDQQTTLSMLKLARERHPWLVATVLEVLAQHGFDDAAIAFADEVGDVTRRAESYAAIIRVLVDRGDESKAVKLMRKLKDIPIIPSRPYEQAMLLAMRSWAERTLYKDDHWRDSFQAALNAAERVDENERAQIMPPMLATLMQTKAKYRITN